VPEFGPSGEGAPPPKSALSRHQVEIDDLKRRRDKTRKIKQGMMQQLLTGRVRLVSGETTA